MSKNQSGSAHIIIVAILGVALISTLGFIFWQNFINKPMTSVAEDITSYAGCIKSEGSVIQESYPETCVSKGGKRFTNTSQSVAPTPPLDGTKYLVVKEWGVKFPYMSDDTLEYATVSNTGISITSARILAADGKTGNCAINHAGGGSVARGKATDIAQTGTPGQNLTWKEYYDSKVEGVTKLNEYYYGFIHDQGVCNDDTTVQMITNDLMRSIVTKVTSI